MSITSFIFYINREYSPCGCYWDCSCDNYNSYIKSFYDIKDAAQYLVDKVTAGKDRYIAQMAVNGVMLTTVPNPIVVKPTSIVFNNPINRGNHNEKNKWFPDEVVKVPENVEFLDKTLKMLDNMLKLSSIMLQPYIYAKNMSIQEKEDADKEKKRKADLKKLEELKKLYPDA